MSTKIELQNIADTAITAISALGAPKVTQIGYPGNDTAADTAGGQIITLTGTGFQSGLNILIGSVSASVVTFISSTEVTFVTPVSAAGTYVMYVINPDGGTGISIPGISYSGTPAWTTAAGTLGSVTETTAIATTVSATGDAPVTYTVASGTVPPGSTLDSVTGLLSGTAPASAGATTYSFVIRASDAQNQDTDRSFSLTINSDVVTWTNPVPGSTVALTQDTAMANIALTAVSAAGAAITYTANALPVGVTLSGNVISGTPTVALPVTTALTATAATTRTAVNVISWTVNVGGDPLLNLTTLLLPGSATTFVRDASANNLAVSVFGDTRPNTFNPYLTGWSNYFDGTGDYLSLTPNSSLTLNGDYTIEFWVYFTSLDTAERIPVNCWNGNLGWLINTQSGAWNFKSAGSLILTYSAVAPAAGQWYHVAATRSGSATNNVKFFINGVQVAQGTNTSTLTPATGSTGCVIGGGQGGTGQLITGYVSNFRIVKGAAVYTAAFTPPSTPLTAMAGTSLLTCADNRFIDDSTNNFAITRSGNVTIDSFAPFVEPVTTRGSAYFDGTGDYLTVPSNSALAFGTGDFTIEAWIYTTSGAGVVWATHESGIGTGWYLSLNAGSLGWGRYGNGSDGDIGGVAVASNQWQHVAVTKSAGNIRVFVNGATNGAVTDSNNYSSIPYNFSIGADQNGDEGLFTGYISNLRVVKGTAVYTAAFTPPTAPLTAVANTSLLILQNNQPTNNSMFLDSSTENFPITRTGNVTQGTFSPYSSSGWSNYFDGNGDNLATPVNAAFQFGTGDFTVECWVNFTSTTSRQDIVWWGATGSDRGGIIYNELAGNLTYYISPTVARAINYAWTPLIGVWYHIALTRVSGSSKLYVNGVQVGSTYADSKNYAGSNYVSVGKDNSAASSYFFGYISNLRMVKGTAVYTTNFTPPTQPLTAISGTSLLTCMDNRFVDDSVNNFAITRTGDVRVQNFSPFRAQTQTPTTYSAFFDGAGNTLSYTLPAAIGTESFTYEAWVYRTSSSSDENLFTNGSASNNGWNMAIDGQKLRARFDSTNFLYSTSNIPVNQWTHCAISRQGSTVRIFVNGVLENTGTSAYNATATLMQIGSWSVGGATYDFTGYISNARIVIGTAVYTATFAPSTQPLTAVAGTSALTCQGPTIVDNSSNRFAITVTGNIRPTAVNPFGFTFANSTGYSAAESGGSMYFDGTGDYLSVAASAAHGTLGTSDFTVECWFNTLVLNGTSGSNTQYIISHRVANIAPYLFWIEAGGALKLYASSDNGSWNLANQVALGTVTTNTWYHLAYTRSGSIFRVFLNGAQVHTFTSAAALTATTGTLNIGGSASDTNAIFFGYISNVRVVKGQALYTSNFAPPLAPVQPTPNTVLLLNGTAAAIGDATTRNVLETVGDVRVSTAVSKFGSSSMAFDGSGDWIQVSGTNPNLAFGTGAFTVEFWFYSLAASGTQQLFDTRPAGTASTTGYMALTYSGSLNYYTAGGNPIAGGTVSANAWHHVALSRSGTSTRLYVDGVQVGSTYTDTQNYLNGLNRPIIGADGNSPSASMTGYIQDFRITTGVARYTTNFTAPTAPFLTS